MSDRSSAYAPSSDADFELARRIAHHERDALRAAYDEHGPALRAFARRLIGSQEGAEDLVHDVFVSLPSAARRFRGLTSLRKFLMGVAANHSRHHVRAAARRRRLLEQASLEREVQGLLDPAIDLESRQFTAALVKALDDLPHAHRIAFVLCEVEGFTSHEAAALVGTSPGNVRVRVHKARERLRAWCQGWVPQREDLGR